MKNVSFILRKKPCGLFGQPSSSGFISQDPSLPTAVYTGMVLSLQVKSYSHPCKLQQDNQISAQNNNPDILNINTHCLSCLFRLSLAHFFFCKYCILPVSCPRCASSSIFLLTVNLDPPVVGCCKLAVLSLEIAWCPNSLVMTKCPSVPTHFRCPCGCYRGSQPRQWHHEARSK